MKKKLSKETKGIIFTATAAATAILVIAETIFASKLFTLVSRGNKALKIYIDKNKNNHKQYYIDDLDDDFFDEDEDNYKYNEDDLSF